MLHLQAFHEGSAHGILPMYHEDPARLFGKGGYPFNESVLIRMSGQSDKRFDAGAYLDRFAKKLHLIGSFHQNTSQRSDCLIAYEQDRTFRPP